MRVRTFGLFGTLAASLLVAACSGGGGGGGNSGGGGPPPTNAPTPTPKPTYVLPSASAAALSSYTIDSLPQHLAASIDGTSIGTTPETASPNYSTSAHVFVIVPQATGTASPIPYTVSLVQTGNGPRTVFYNQAVDTAGKITKVSATPVARLRSHGSLLGSANGPRRFALSVAQRPEYDAHRLVVHFAVGRLGAASLADLERSHGAERAATYSQSTQEVVRIVTLASGVDVESARAAFASDSRVASVDRVRLRYPLSASAGPVYPNDPFYTSGQQWYLDVIDATDAWGYGLGNPGVSIAIVDTGYDPHQTEVAPGVTKAATIVGGTIDTTGATDTDGHGTYVSGIASAQTNNDAGFSGVAFGASLQEYKVFSDGTSPTADAPDVAEAIRLAVANGAKIILTALGGTPDAGPDPLERDAVAFAIQNGVTVIAGSGDEGLGALDYPAAYDGVVSVGASAINDSGTPGTPYGVGNSEYVPPYSNAGPALGMVAPGGYPSSAGDTDGVHWIVNAYTTQPYAGDPACASGTLPAACAILDYGTTPAAAEVAGTAALMLSLSPALTPSQVAAILYQSADDIGDPNEGHGRLNAHRALAVVANDPSPQPAVPLPSNVQFVAFAYDNAGGTTPHVLDETFPKGVPVSSTGTFRIADIPGAAAGTYKIAVWADLNGDGVVDAGDYFGVVSATCAASGPCAHANAISAGLVPAGYTLP